MQRTFSRICNPAASNIRIFNPSRSVPGRSVRFATDVQSDLQSSCIEYMHLRCAEIGGLKILILTASGLQIRSNGVLTASGLQIRSNGFLLLWADVGLKTFRTGSKCRCNRGFKPFWQPFASAQTTVFAYANDRSRIRENIRAVRLRPEGLFEHRQR